MINFYNTYNLIRVLGYSLSPLVMAHTPVGGSGRGKPGKRSFCPIPYPPADSLRSW
jgi:hypothetical protein